jgi:DNA repair protein RadD
MFTLFEDQDTSVNGVREAYRTGYRAPILVSPTGSGKTVMFCYMAMNAMAKGKRVIILVHRYELLRQVSKALTQFGIMHGIIHPSFRPNKLAMVQVASVQTLVNRLKDFDKSVELIIIDEAHHAVADSWTTTVGAMPNSLILGTTATPVRTDGRGLGKLSGGMFDTMVMGPQISELIAKGRLKQYKTYGPGDYLDLSDIKRVRGEYEKKQLEVRLNNRSITGNAVDEYRRICPYLPAIAFCLSVQHANDVANDFCNAGFRFAPIDGKMSDAERTRRLEGLADGTYHGLTSCDLISEGTDVPAACVAICLRPTMSLSLWLQMCGRPGRYFPGQDFAYVLDHSLNIYRHGFPDEDRNWSLDTKYVYDANIGAGEEMRSKAVQCKNCNALVRRAPRCPECGVGMIITKPMIVKEGRLQELTIEDKNKMDATGQVLDQREIQPLSYFQEIAVRKQYKMGWANINYKLQFKNK